jgi:hypothetical protein
MNDWLLTAHEIASWMRSKAAHLGPGVSLVEVSESDNEYKPGALADFVGASAVGRITGWASGEFDFEVLRIADGEFVFFRTLKIVGAEDLEETFREFIRTVFNPPDSGPPQAV